MKYSIIILKGGMYVLRKIPLGIKIVLPFILNVLLFYWIYDINKNSEYALTDTLFVLGMINLIYGLGALFITRGNGTLFLRSRSRLFTGINYALADQYIKNHHNGDKKKYKKRSITANQLKLIYVILGVLLCVGAFIV